MVNVMKIQTTVLFFAAVLVSGFAFAEQGSAISNESLVIASTNTGQKSFNNNDLNGDGQISRVEARAGNLPRLFIFMDKNGDNMISRKEFNFTEH